MHGLEAKYSGQMNFVYLDIDDPATNGFKRDLGYIAQPHIFLLDAQGNVLKTWLGRVTAEEFEAEFAKALEATQ